MAKAQSFADKVKKKKAEDAGYTVKVIKSYRSDIGTIRFFERFVHVKDLTKFDEIDITR